MADFDARPCINEKEQPAIIQPFAHVWNQMIGCEQAKAASTGNKFKEVQQKDAEPVAGSFSTDVKSPIADIKIPDGWTSSRTERGGIGQRALDEFSPPDSSAVTLSIFQEGLPLKDKAINALSEVLSKGNHQLLPNEIVAVRDAIGYSNAGDNQYTDKNYRPAFNLTGAGVQTINDSQVLVVEGKYNNGGKMFKGIFAPFVDDQGKTRVQQVFMEGAPDAFPKYLGTYKNVVDSIKWKPETQKGTDGTSKQDDSPPPHNTGMLR
jgi:hypothetical protein